MLTAGATGEPDTALLSEAGRKIPSKFSGERGFSTERVANLSDEPLLDGAKMFRSRRGAWPCALGDADPRIWSPEELLEILVAGTVPALGRSGKTSLGIGVGGRGTRALRLRCPCTLRRGGWFPT